MAMQIKTKSRKTLILLTSEEDAQITAAALTDPDNLPLTDAELSQFKRGRGKPAGSGTKQQVTLRLIQRYWSNSKRWGVAGKPA